MIHRPAPCHPRDRPPSLTSGDQETDSHDVRTDRADKAGKITLRHGGRLYSIGLDTTKR